MSNYRHERQFTVNFSDVDFKDECRLSALLSYVQETACSSADELGFGYEHLRPLGYGFVVVATACELLRPIRLGEKITVQTWPLTPKMVIFERDYRILAENGEILANLASRWCLVDMQSMKLLTPDKLSAHASCPYNDTHSCLPNWKIPKLNGEGENRGDFFATPSLCDHYLHINNAKYADLFCDCFSMEELSARPLKGFQVTYHKQIRAGKEFSLFRKDEEGRSLLECHTDEGVCTQCALYYR